MAFTDLTAVVDIMRDENSGFLPDYTDEQLTALKRAGALKRLRIDIVDSMNLENSSDAIMDELADTYSDRLNNALTLLQLAMFYHDNSDGEGSLTEARFIDYTKRYNEMKGNFDSMKTDIDTTYITKVVKFKIG